MALACPRCKHDGILDLPDFWKSLPRGSELRGKYAQPEEHSGQWLLPVAAVLLGVLALASGAIGAGILLLAGGAAVGFWLSRRRSAAELARERWARSLYCRQCPATFLREDALAV